MAFDISATVASLRWVLGDSDAVSVLEEAAAYVAGVEKERDDAVIAAAAANEALLRAQEATTALNVKLADIYEDLKDGILDTPVPTAPVEEPAPEVVA